MRDPINVPHMRQELLDGQVCECGDPRCTPSALLSDMGIDHPRDATVEQLTAWALEASTPARS